LAGISLTRIRPPFRRPGQARLDDVPPDHRGARDAVQHAAGVRQHDRIVVDVDDAGLRAGLQRDLVRVAHRGQSGADVDDLLDASLADQVADDPAEEGPVPLHRQPDVRQLRDHRLADRAVGRVIVLAAEQVVIDPRDARDVRPERFAPVTVVGHQPDPLASPPVCPRTISQLANRRSRNRKAIPAYRRFRRFRRLGSGG
jgi:hypothetical protein